PWQSVGDVTPVQRVYQLTPHPAVTGTTSPAPFSARMMWLHFFFPTPLHAGRPVVSSVAVGEGAPLHEQAFWGSVHPAGADAPPPDIPYREQGLLELLSVQVVG
ncbi:hypothetical protein NDU88_003407, partial [Pleurodeles waltl]